MRLDNTAAAYGLIHVVFSDVTVRFARAVFFLRKQHDATVTFEEIYRTEFARILRAFKDELKKLEKGQRLPDGHDIQVLRDACCELAKLGRWRNDRVHAIVKPVDDGLALYDWRTGERLSISYEECHNILDHLTRVIVTLEAYLPAVVGSVELENEIEAFFQQLADEEVSTEL